MAGWQFWIDRGGTFTDVVAQTPAGHRRSHKLLSENPEQYDDAAIQAIRDLMGLEPSEPVPAKAIEAVKMGTTVATNALLEHRGEPTLLAITSGFGDLLDIGDQSRPDLFALEIRKPKPLYQQVLEIEARFSASGETLAPPNAEQIEMQLKEAYAQGFRAIAIVFLHAYRYPQHEKLVADLAKKTGFTQISTSHETSPLIKVVDRGATTVVDAYLSPILRRYVNQVTSALEGVPLWFMQSHGGLVSAELFQGKDSVLSGPAGGIVGAVKVCDAAGFDRVITFDMGGTSTDVAHYRGRYERTTQKVIAGTRINAPMMEIHTVAAGGGSILNFDGQRMTVGPASAGAVPGPRCYGRSGPLTVTDANLLLGRLVPASFPKVFGPEGKDPLDVAAVENGFENLCEQWQLSTGQQRSIQALAEGALEIAVQNMARAIKKISVQRGYDPADYVLCVFGGAAGQLACAVADALSMRQIFIHPYASVLSAFGMGLAEPRVLERQTLEHAFDEDGLRQAKAMIAALEAQAMAKLASQGVVAAQKKCRIGLRYAGSDQVLEVPLDDLGTIQQAFEQRHQARFGFIAADQPLVMATVILEAIGPSESLDVTAIVGAFARANQLPSQTNLWVNGAFQEVPLRSWAELEIGESITGPALIVSDHATVVVEAGWEALHEGHLVLNRVAEKQTHLTSLEAMDPVQLEIFNSAFMSIAEQMGFTLQNTAASVNMKERLDFSCAIFDGEGALIANAPHMPVHLGSMGESVRALIRAHGENLKPGDVFASNNPYDGGTHLPDITVIAPVFSQSQQRIAFVASRGHHADVGGLTPGSMPPFSTVLSEEGILLDNERLVSQGAFLEKELLEKLNAGAYPARNPQKNLADLKAQIASLNKGIHEYQQLVARHGLEVVEAYMGFVQDYAEASVRRVLGGLSSGRFTYEMDTGAQVTVRVSVDHEEHTATVDFAGTSAQVANNFNAPSAVCKAAVLYVFRSLIQEDLPLNAGCLRPLKILIPNGSMLQPKWPAAVVAGNVETSQVITDALYGALGVMAGAQGTMNNFTFGNETHQYYETIAGGSGAGPGFHGANGVQTHMTNSRMTDPEILELRFPVILEKFAYREDSGGKGCFQGGRGLVRRFRFVEQMTAALLSNRRLIPPFGLQGGTPGQLGEAWVYRLDGSKELLPGLGEVTLDRGERLEIRTPGGGGFGS